MTASTATRTAKAATKPAAKSVLKGLVKDGTGSDAQFYRVRANGTRRHVPLLTGDDLKAAEAIAAERTGDSPKTLRQIATERHVSVSTLRRIMISLAATREHLANQAKAENLRTARKSKKATAPAKKAGQAKITKAADAEDPTTVITSQQDFTDTVVAALS